MNAVPVPRPDHDLTPVWRALADVTRRQMLDYLREQPMTTGELAERFPITRFGVMKHLRVLVDAGLVIVRRRGRERWNHLNPLPIQQIHHRWIRSFEAESAERLLRLKGVAERLEEEYQMTTAKQQTGPVDVQLEVRISAPRERVWQALTNEIGRWWPAKFYVGPAPVRFTVEPRVGGRVFEDWGDGEGALWAIVSSVRKHEVLQFVGDIPADYGGPGRNVTTYSLEADGNETVLAFRDTTFGEMSDMYREHVGEGWRFLLYECLQPYVEEGRQPERPESVVRAEEA